MSWPDIMFEDIYVTPSRNGIYKPKEFHGRGCRIVNMGEIFGFDFISNQDMNRLELNETELLTNSLEDGDLLFGRRSLVESGAGKCSIVVEPLDVLTFESSIIRVRLNKCAVNPRFFYYYFQSPQGRGRIRSIVSGTNVKGIRGSDLKRLLVTNPPKDVQDTVVSILSSYDNLIENNRRRMALLEESARLLYREWFVRLRFPGYEHTRIVDGVPDGWRPQVLGNLCLEIREQVMPDSVEPDTPYIGLEHMPRRSIILNEWGFATDVSSSKHRFREGEILFGKIRPYFHKVGFALIDGIVSSDAIVIRANDEKTRPLLLMAVSSDEFVATTAQEMKEGSKMPRADWKQMQQYPIAIPSEAVLSSFNELILPILNQLKALSFANQKLCTARDLLLPRLMCGEIEV
jgi:type I restriction enzyme S subunit